MKNSLIRRICGLTEEAAPVVPVTPDVAEPSMRRARADYDEEVGATNVDAVPSEQVVQMLAHAWKSGQREDVASQLLFTPVSYADFVKFCFVIGQGEAVQLGLMLDDMSDASGLTTDEPSENRILSRVGQQRELDAGPPEAQELPQPPQQQNAMPPEDEQMPEEDAEQPPPPPMPRNARR